MDFFHPTNLEESLQEPACVVKPLKLVLFDFDGTLVEFPGSTILPGVKEWFAKSHPPVAIVSNCGGVGLRYWQESENFGDPDLLPTQAECRLRIADFQSAVEVGDMRVYVCFAYQSKKSGNWGPVPHGMQTSAEWDKNYRKPKPGMLLQAIYDHRVKPEEALMVGDWPEDRQAAAAAGVIYIDANDFFGRRK